MYSLPCSVTHASMYLCRWLEMNECVTLARVRHIKLSSNIIVSPPPPPPPPSPPPPCYLAPGPRRCFSDGLASLPLYWSPAPPTPYHISSIIVSICITHIGTDRQNMSTSSPRMDPAAAAAVAAVAAAWGIFLSFSVSSLVHVWPCMGLASFGLMRQNSNFKNIGPHTFSMSSPHASWPLRPKSVMKREVQAVASYSLR